jgi:preprotein translocase subunit SecY
MSITLEEAYQGVAKIIELEGQKIRIKLKPGTYEGLMIRLPVRRHQVSNRPVIFTSLFMLNPRVI